MRRKIAVVAVILIAAAAAAFFSLFLPAGTPPEPEAQVFTHPVPTASSIPAPVQAPPPVPAETIITHPLEGGPATDVLPALDQSDAPMLKVLSEVLGNKWLPLLLPEHLIHNIVVTVDNLPRKTLPASVVPLKRVRGSLIVSGEGGERTISPHNQERYGPYIKLFEAVDSEKLLAAYRRFYPLFQRAYEDIGYPNAYFNDRLVDAIDDLLAAPEIDGPIRLVQPKVLYQFADPDLAGRSAGQKIMIRMGQDNAVRLKAKLREIRHGVAAK